MTTLIQKEWVAGLPRKMLVPYYLMASYLYYHADSSAMTDDAYDFLCQRLNKEWPIIEHRHKSIVKRSSLTATTGYNIKRNDYPILVQVAAFALLQRVERDRVYEDMQEIKGFSHVAAPKAKPRLIVRRPAAAPTQPAPTRVLPRRVLR